jgi:hypothetical protein
MINYKISFVTCGFTKDQIEAWLNWVQTNMPCAEEQPTITEVTDARYAKAGDSSVKWFDQ